MNILLQAFRLRIFCLDHFASGFQPQAFCLRLFASSFLHRARGLFTSGFAPPDFFPPAASPQENRGVLRFWCWCLAGCVVWRVWFFPKQDLVFSATILLLPCTCNWFFPVLAGFFRHHWAHKKNGFSQYNLFLFWLQPDFQTCQAHLQLMQ